tara:strand:- start:946 stop:1185 length:240 start_codon:yes stop_codon:yes gene_type:complete
LAGEADSNGLIWRAISIGGLTSVCSFPPTGVGWLQRVVSAQRVLVRFTLPGHEGNDGDITTSPVEGLVPGNWQTFAADI